MKITGGFIGNRTFYFYDDNRLIVDDSFHGKLENEWKEDIDINQICNYVQENQGEEKNNDSFCIELKNGSKKYFNKDNEDLKAFFNEFWNYILK